MAATDLGTDISCIVDLDANLTVVSGRLALAQAVARRWLTVPGSLWYAPTYGAGLLTALSGSVQSVDEWSRRLESEALKDERLLECTAAVAFANEQLSVRGRLVDADGPFSLTLDVSNLTVNILVEA